MKKKNSTAHQTILKNKNIYLRDKKINKVYRIFKNILVESIGNQHFCIGVSGGPDSLALAFLSKIYAKEFNVNYNVLVVDHGLREESKEESKEVRSLLLKEGILSKILTWNGKKPKSNIQLNARKIRYKLLLNECHSIKVKNLILGHQMDDFVENFVIRLFRGSGLKGLSSFNQISFTNKNNQKLIRPLINISKKDLIYISKKVFKNYITDPSNFKDKYLRTRIRTHIKNLKSDGLNINKVKLTIKNLQIAESSLDYYYQRSIKNYVRVINKSKYIINAKLFDSEAEETIFRLIGYVIAKVANTYYPPRGQSLKHLIKQMKKNKFFKGTLGKCIIERVKNSFIVKKEHNK